MPGNIVKINDSDSLEWYVGDSQMEALIEFLDEIGFREGDNETTDIQRENQDVTKTT